MNFLTSIINNTPIIKYIISGSIAAVINLVCLYFFTDLLRIWYLISAVLAFLVSFVMSFTLQKFWTFQDRNLSRVDWQVIIYLIVSVANLAANTFLIFVMVEYLYIWYMFAQIIAGAILALFSFFIYSRLIFHRSAA